MPGHPVRIRYTQAAAPDPASEVEKWDREARKLLRHFLVTLAAAITAVVVAGSLVAQPLPAPLLGGAYLYRSSAP